MYLNLTSRELIDTNNKSNESVAYVDNLSKIVGNTNKMELQEYIQTVYDTTLKYLK